MQTGSDCERAWQMTFNCKTKCNPCLCATAEGERLKANALTLLEPRREVFVRRGRRAMLEVLLRSGTATADDVRSAIELPPDLDPRCLGSVPGRLAYAHIIRAAGFVRSARPERHACWVQVWELADRNKALQWLADHPDLEDTFEQSKGAATSQRALFPIHPTNEPGATAATAAPGMES
jgi:hypothetical protein